MANKISTLKLTSIVAIIAFVFLTGCGGDSTDSTSENTDSTEKKADKYILSEPSTAGMLELMISGNDEMQFDKKELRAKTGEKIALTLKHTGKLPAQSMGHNLVILKPGTDVSSFAKKAINAVGNDYIPEGDEMIAYTRLIGGGESVTISFTAPAPGSYDFICTFPGHYALMNGKLIVK